MPTPDYNINRLPWIFGGSQFMIQASWGRYKKNHGEVQFFMDFYDCGVILLPKNYVNFVNGKLNENNWDESMLEDDYLEPVDLPFQIPCERFTRGEEVYYYEDVYGEGKREIIIEL